MINQLRNLPPPEYTRAQLRQLTRERGLRGYSRLRKSELLQRLRAPRDQILDQGIDARMANLPFLTPTPYVPPTPTPSPTSNAVEDLIDYLNNVEERPKSFSSPKLQKLKNEVDRIFEELKNFKVEEGNSALKEFAKVYTIKGIKGYDVRSFLLNAFQNMTRVLRDNRKSKGKLVLKWNLEKGNTPEEMEIKPADFHSNMEINLDGTDEKELYVTMTERILENMASFQIMGSSWKLRSIIQL